MLLPNGDLATTFRAEVTLKKVFVHLRLIQWWSLDINCEIKSYRLKFPPSPFCELPIVKSLPIQVHALKRKSNLFGISSADTTNSFGQCRI